MDGENSYESDISESWSLVDINLNEESVSVTDAQPKLEESNLPDPKNVNLKKSDSLELEEFVRQCQESMTDFHRCCHSDSDSSVENNKGFKEDESDRGSEQDKNDSGDAESIEIIDLDENHIDSEIERLDISVIDNQELRNSAYQSDDEESWGGNIDNKNRSTSLTVIPRKRNLVRHSKSSDDIVNSDIISKGNPSLSSHSVDEKKLKMQLDAISKLPVYKHYRNNVVNTVLSLSMGIVFAGVACIAIGHFLGVHDAAETAVELVDALKKLQMENVALQSRWSQLHKDAFRQNVNSKFEVPLEPLEAVPCKERPSCATARTKTTNIDQADVYENQFRLKSIQWLNKLESLINEKIATEGNEIDLSSIGKYIHNQLNIINDKKIEGFKHIEDSDRKISKLLQNIIEKLSASQENIEKLYNRLIRLMDKVNHKLFSEKARKKVPVTENDLHFVKLCPTVKNPPEEYSKSVLVYEFPRPEDFYDKKNNSNMTGEKTMTKNNNNNTLKEKGERKVKKEEKSRKKWGKKLRREKPKETEKKLHKKVKHRTKISDKIPAKKNDSKEPGQMEFIFGRFNDSKETDRKFLKKKNEEKVKGKVKKNKISKIVRAALPKQSKEHLKRNKYSRVCSGYECFNLTGLWIFKYADGREEFRRHQTLSEWQFERARGRKEQRNEDDVESWQFRRALARENGRNDNRWHRERYRKNRDSQDFIHEPIS